MLTIIPKSSPESVLLRPTSLSAQAGAFAGKIVSSARATGLVSAIFGASIAMLSNSPAGLCAGGAAFALILSAKQVFEIKRLNAWHAESSVNLKVAGKEIDDLRNKNNNLVKESKVQASTVTEQSSRIEFMTTNLRGLVIENRALKSKVTDLESRVTDLAAINTATLTMIEPLRTEIALLKATTASDKSQMEKLKAENEGLSTANEQLVAANRALTEMVAKLKELGLERIEEIKAKAQSSSEDVEPVPESISASAASSISDDFSQDVVPVSESTSASATSSAASSISDELSVDAEIAQMMAEIGETEAHN